MTSAILSVGIELPEPLDHTQMHDWTAASVTKDKPTAPSTKRIPLGDTVAGSKRALMGEEQPAPARMQNPLDSVSISDVSTNIYRLMQEARTSGDPEVNAAIRNRVEAALELARNGHERTATISLQNAIRFVSLDPSRFAQIYGTSAVAESSIHASANVYGAPHDTVTAVTAIDAVEPLSLDGRTLNDSGQFQRAQQFLIARARAADLHKRLSNYFS